MRIALIQQNVTWRDAERNRAVAARLIRNHPHADLYVLPEMFTTGFCMRPEEVAETTDGPTLEWMKQQAAGCDAAVAGTVPVVADGRFYNRFYFVHPDGQVQYYDKRHLFTYGGEPRRYTAGSERVVVEYRGWRILLQICYDLRFPVWSRNRGDYDLILYAANWPESRAAVWDVLLRARALENQCYVAGVNRVGDDPSCHYAGGTALIDAYGSAVALCWPEQEEVALQTLDKEALEAFRHKFPVLDDRDRYLLNSSNVNL